MKFRSGQMVKLYPRFKMDAHGLRVGVEYPVYRFIAETNQVMFMGVTEHYVDANILVPARKSKKSKRR